MKTCLVRDIPESAILYSGSNATQILVDHGLDLDIYNVWIDQQSNTLYTYYWIVPYLVDTAGVYRLHPDYS